MSVSTAVREEERRYLERTPLSRRFFEAAKHSLPGGDSRSTLFYPPYPAVFDRGVGAKLWDLDGNELLDFTGNHSSLVLGYGYPAIDEAVRQQVARGSCFPGASEPQLRLAQLLCERVDSLERVRFTNSGTEACMNAVRAARAFTGRPKIAKAEGSYHGTFDEVMSDSEGLAPGAGAQVIVLPFNDARGATRLIEEHARDLAAVLIEPVQGSAGMIPADREYLAALRKVTERHGILLVFDEVVSLRIAPGGAQAYFGVRPDLTCLGKLIGGGFPLGSFGGRADVMALFDPSRGRPRIPHPGSYNANPVSLAAGIAVLETLTAEAITGLNRRGELLRARIAEQFAAAGLAVQCTGLGSLFGIHLTPSPVRRMSDALRSDAALRHRLFLGLYVEGVLIDPRGVGTLSTALSDADVERFSSALGVVLRRLVR